MREFWITRQRLLWMDRLSGTIDELGSSGQPDRDYCEWLTITRNGWKGYLEPLIEFRSSGQPDRDYCEWLGITRNGWTSYLEPLIEFGCSG
jgi:hypothetical protein